MKIKIKAKYKIYAKINGHTINSEVKSKTKVVCVGQKKVDSMICTEYSVLAVFRNFKSAA